MTQVLQETALQLLPSVSSVILREMQVILREMQDPIVDEIHRRLDALEASRRAGLLVVASWNIKNLSLDKLERYPNALPVMCAHILQTGCHVVAIQVTIM